MISHNIKWFLGLSVAAHTAVLVSWPSPEQTIGHSGQALLLSVNNRTGEAIARQHDLDASHSQSVPQQTLQSQAAVPLPKTTAAAVKQQAVEQQAVRPPPEAPEQAHNRQPATATQAASMTISREEQDQHLRASVMDLIARQLTYPAIARRKGWQGVVKLELHIESDGLISALHVDETSGYAVLDRAAMESLQLASIPGASQWLHGHSIDMLIPIEYRLLDS